MNLYDLKKELDESGIMMCFNGPFSHSIIEETGKAIRSHLAAGQGTQMTVLDVFAIYVELAQNVCNYIITHKITQAEAKSSIITIAKNNDGYAISCGNMVRHEDKEKLLARIEAVNNMTPEERKSETRKILRQEQASETLGAGLGFLQIAKRSSAKMHYDFQRIDDTFVFFNLTAFV